MQPSRRRGKKRRKRSDQSGSLERGQVVKDFELLKSSLRKFEPHELRDLLGHVGYDLLPVREDVPDSAEQFDDARDMTFDDDVPSDLPLNMTDPPPYNGPENPEWCKFAAEAPSCWPGMMVVSHPSPWLHTLFVPAEHRANITLTTTDLSRNHHFVYWRASLSIWAQRPLHELSSNIAACFGPVENMDMHDRRWAAAISNDTVSLFYFGMKREQIVHKGFCVLEGILDDARMPETIGNENIPKVGGNGRFFVDLYRHMEKSVPRGTVLSVPGSPSEWVGIVNGGAEEDAINKDSGVGRYSSTHYGVTEAIERNPDRVWACKARAILDARIGQAMAALQLWDNRCPCKEKMYMPRTGRRWLYTSEGCQRQQLHTDFATLSRSETLSGTGNPGYFAICSGEKEISLWVSSYSHYTVSAASLRTLAALGYGSIAILEKVPPFSLFIGRGDVFYAGASFNDIPGGNPALRYHLYFVPENVSLPDGVHIMNKFQPRFIKEIGGDSDDERDQQYVHDDREGLRSPEERIEVGGGAEVDDTDFQDQEITFA